MLAEINISYLSVNLSSAERPKVISILSGLTLFKFVGGNVSVQILTLHFDPYSTMKLSLYYSRFNSFSRLLSS